MIRLKWLFKVKPLMVALAWLKDSQWGNLWGMPPNYSMMLNGK
jgi:hypothetical protein